MDAVNSDIAQAIQLSKAGRLVEAQAICRRILQSQPGHPDALFQLALICHQAGRTDAAVELLERLVAVRPSAAVHINLGTALATQGKLGQAITHFEQALLLRPDYADAYNNLGNALKEQGKPHLAITHFARALALRPDFTEAHSNLLFTLNYVPGNDPAVLYTAHLEYARRCEAPLARSVHAHSNDRSPERRLRVGYVSSDFRRHSVANFMEPVLENHDRGHFDIFCYFNHLQEDEVTVRLKSHADHWRGIFGLSDELTAKQIETDQIDVLVDLNGHTALNCLPVFARKPAPIQVTWLGYPNTTGLSAINYRITDELADPIGMTERIHSERLVRLPECFLCYQLPHDTPEVSRLPAAEKGYITFGSFNNMAKISQDVMAVWAGILRDIPGARLMLKNFSLREPVVQQMVQEVFGASGIKAERLELSGFDDSMTTHLERYRSIDIALDTFPYNGTTTTCEALWMGVPVVTLAGRVHAGRVGLSLLSAVGLPELIAGDPADYVAGAVALAADRNRLSDLRVGMRERLRASPLCDGRAFTRNLEAAYRTMWRQWCGQCDTHPPG